MSTNLYLFIFFFFSTIYTFPLSRKTATSVTKSPQTTKHYYIQVYSEFPRFPGIIKFLSHIRNNPAKSFKPKSATNYRRNDPPLPVLLHLPCRRKAHASKGNSPLNPWGSWSVNRRCHRQRGEDGRAFLLEGRRDYRPWRIDRSGGGGGRRN